MLRLPFTTATKIGALTEAWMIGRTGELQRWEVMRGGNGRFRADGGSSQVIGLWGRGAGVCLLTSYNFLRKKGSWKGEEGVWKDVQW